MLRTYREGSLWYDKSLVVNWSHKKGILRCIRGGGIYWAYVNEKQWE